jgi:hypothetical protein
MFKNKGKALEAALKAEANALEEMGNQKRDEDKAREAFAAARRAYDQEITRTNRAEDKYQAAVNAREAIRKAGLFGIIFG